ncbi:hypothetical protein AJ79_05358 [Helicocarpus griseus UAMH5409]|uniref:Deoxyribonuclease NucA/NucB domain-containing protein n=1 Tax=Helicocarpus griseus UAMH5409 TaxID=1447875 RepID=A0A2B7XG06_9EURO|nr:hypothetical protein AJ79_05358 [Helicocarpus griseus UAMH5409]
MLCLLNGNRIYQRVNNQAAIDRNYRASGASYRPFRDSELANRHTSQINSNTVSAEEFPWKSTQEGGPNAYVFPATQAEQNSQGGTIGGAYSHNDINYGDFFRITFTGSPFGPYCSALFSKNPDNSICGKKTSTLFGTQGVNVANFAYQVVKSGALPYAFMHVAGPNKGKITKRLEGVEVQPEESAEQ